MRVHKFLWAIAPAALASTLLSGCGGSSGVTTVPLSTLHAGSPVAHKITPTTIDDQVEAIAVQTADLPTTQDRRLIPAGDQVSGQVTMDNCGFDFTTEAFRVARREYVVTDQITGQTAIGNEVVAYDTPAHAVEALGQWYRAAAHCPSTPFRSTVAGVPPITAKVLSDVRDVADLPAKPNVVTVERQQAADIGTMYGSARLQLHGRIIDIMYVSTQSTVSKVVDDQAVQLAQVTGKRLLATN